MKTLLAKLGLSIGGASLCFYVAVKIHCIWCAGFATFDLLMAAFVIFLIARRKRWI